MIEYFNWSGNIPCSSDIWGW